MKRLLVLSHAAILEVNRALFEHLARIAQVDITLLAPTHWKGDLIENLSLQKIGPNSTLQLISYPVIGSGNGSLFFYRTSIRQVIQKLNPDFLFLDEEPWSLTAWQSLQTETNIVQFFYTKQNILKKLPPPFSWIQKRTFQASRFALTVSQESAEVLRAKNFTAPIHYLPHSYDDQIFSPLSAPEKIHLRRQLSIPENATVIAYFGRLTPEKGIHDLLSALQLLDQKSISAHFLCVGEGPLAAEIHKFCQKFYQNQSYLSITQLTAIPHDKVGRTLALADILVLPSRTYPHWKEQFGRILVEALASQVAVIGSDSGEIPNLIRKTDGGLVFPEGDVNALCDVLLDLITHPEKLSEFKQKGFHFVKNHFTHEKVAQSLAQILGLRLK